MGRVQKRLSARACHVALPGGDGREREYQFKNSETVAPMFSGVVQAIYSDMSFGLLVNSSQASSNKNNISHHQTYDISNNHLQRAHLTTYLESYPNDTVEVIHDRPGNCDSKGLIHNKREDLDENKKYFMQSGSDISLEKAMINPHVSFL